MHANARNLPINGNGLGNEFTRVPEVVIAGRRHGTVFAFNFVSQTSRPVVRLLYRDRVYKRVFSLGNSTSESLRASGDALPGNLTRELGPHRWIVFTKYHKGDCDGDECTPFSRGAVCINAGIARPAARETTFPRDR